MNQTSIGKTSMAEKYCRNPESVEIYRYDTPFEAVFADGSKVIFDILGHPKSVIPPNHAVILLEKMAAEKRGRQDRLSRFPIDPSYKTSSKKHLPCVAEAYRIGWFSVPNWPKRPRRFR